MIFFVLSLLAVVLLMVLLMIAVAVWDEPRNLICPCGKLLATRKRWQLKIGWISGEISAVGLPTWLLGFGFVPTWNRLVDGPCPCKPSIRDFPGGKEMLQESQNEGGQPNE